MNLKLPAITTKNLRAAAKAALKIGKEKSPQILTALAVGGLVFTTVTAVKATLKAKEVLDNMEEDASKEEKAKVIAKTYAPVFASGALTCASIIGAQAINSRRMAALAGLYSLAESTIKEYEQNTSKETQKKVEESVADKELQKAPLDNRFIEETGRGKELCYDIWSGRYFWGSMLGVREVLADFNRDLIYQNSMTINDLYEELGMDSCELGYMVGWKSGDIIRAEFNARLASDGTPCLVVKYKPDPYVSFRDW